MFAFYHFIVNIHYLDTQSLHPFSSRQYRSWRASQQTRSHIDDNLLPANLICPGYLLNIQSWPLFEPDEIILQLIQDEHSVHITSLLHILVGSLAL